MTTGEQRATGMRLVGAPAAPDIEPLLTAAEVGRVLAIPTKRVYEVVGHLAVQLAPHTLRWKASDLTALIEARRRK